MRLFLDESGDLGWTLDKKYREGGSSQYLTVALMFLPEHHNKKPKNLIKSMYDQYKWASEKKASSAILSQKVLFCNKAVDLLKRYQDIKIDVITAKKENVQEHIRQDSNKLYNYMTGLVVPDYTATIDTLEFIPDERTVKVKSGNSLVDFLQTKLWFDVGHKTTIVNKPERSFKHYNLQFMDWIAHCVWMNFEDSVSQPYQIILPHIKHRKLYFNDTP